ASARGCAMSGLTAANRRLTPGTHSVSLPARAVVIRRVRLANANFELLLFSLRRGTYDNWEKVAATRTSGTAGRHGPHTLPVGTGAGRRGHLRAPAQQRQGAPELADAPGQLCQLELVVAQHDQQEQRREPQGQVHGVAGRPDAAQQGDAVLHAA